LALLGPESSAFVFGVVIFVAGIFFGGPHVILGAVVSSDLVKSDFILPECF